MILGRIIEIADELGRRIADLTHEFYLGVPGRGGEDTLAHILDEVERLDVLRTKVAWYEARFVIEDCDATIAEARVLLDGLRIRRDLFSCIAGGFVCKEGDAPAEFVVGLNEDAVRVSLAAVVAEEEELTAMIEDALWSSEVIDADVDGILGIDAEVRMSTRGVELPAAAVPTVPSIEVAPVASGVPQVRPPAVPREEVIYDDGCPLCFSDHRAEIEEFAASAEGDVMATLDFATQVCGEHSLTPKDVTMHLDDHAPKYVRSRRLGPR